MTAASANNNLWWQIAIDDDSGLSGIATAQVLALVAKKADLSHAKVQSVEGAGVRLSEIQTDIGCVMSIDELLPIVETMIQFDWADFFLTDNEVQARQIHPNETYPESLRKCSVLVRAVDDTYFYVYGQQPELKTALDDAFPRRSSKIGVPEKLDYPE